MSEQSGTPSRYQRTTQGLIASMIVTVVAVVIVFLALRLDNGGAEKGPAKVDYLEAVQAARDADIAVVYPPRLPAGWKATSVAYDAGNNPSWGIGTLTAAGTFAGIRQQAAGLDRMLTAYVDDDPSHGADVTLDSPLATTWSTWSDSGGDHAYAAQVEVDGQPQTVLVYGSASTSDLRELLESLVVG